VSRTVDHPRKARSDPWLEQAKGVLAERNGLSVEATFDALRLYDRDQNIKLTDLAVTVVHNNSTPGFPRAAWDGASP
jgi:AmiR/NasT family two-component response regulator